MRADCTSMLWTRMSRRSIDILPLVFLLCLAGTSGCGSKSGDPTDPSVGLYHGGLSEACTMDVREDGTFEILSTRVDERLVPIRGTWERLDEERIRLSWSDRRGDSFDRTLQITPYSAIWWAGRPRKVGEWRNRVRYLRADKLHLPPPPEPLSDIDKRSYPLEIEKR